MYLKEWRLDVRVLCLMTDAFGGRGGIAQYNRDFLTALSQSDNINEVVVVPRLIAEKVFELPTKIKQLKPLFDPFFYSLYAFWVTLRQGPFEFVFCGHIRMVGLALFLSKIIHKPFWLQIHGIEAWEPPNPINAMAVQYAARVLAVSRFSRRKLLAWSTIDPLKVKILPNAVDISRFTPGPKSANLLRRWGIEGCRVLLTVSRLDASERYKGHPLVIGIMPDLLRKFPTLRYVIAGTGNDQDFLRKLAETKNVKNEVIFVGQIDEVQNQNFTGLADVFVMPSKKEGFGIVFLEALASGISVIAGNKDGSVDPLGDGVSGTLIHPDDLESLILAIEAQLAKPSGSKESASKFTFECYRKHLEQLLQLNFAMKDV